MKDSFMETYTGTQKEKILVDMAKSKLTTGMSAEPQQYGYQGGNLVAQSQTYLRGQESAQIAGTDQPIGDFAARFVNPDFQSQPRAYANDYDMFEDMFGKDFPTPNYFNANNKASFQF